jgi:DNA-binding GntR family transcriptional regulator
MLDTIDVMPARIRIAAIVRKAILSGEYPVGTELSLTEISAQVGVSRTPVREAFQMLANEGLIELRMNKSAIVNEISTEIIRDHYDMRRMLEGEAAARATNNRMDTAPLVALHDEILAKGSDLTSEDFRKYNQIFHTSVWKAAKSPRLTSFLTILWNGSSFGRTVPESRHQDISISEHGRLLEHIRANEPGRARSEMESHILRSMKNILDSYNLGD